MVLVYFAFSGYNLNLDLLFGRELSLFYQFLQFHVIEFYPAPFCTAIQHVSPLLKASRNPGCPPLCQ